jgi:hypothetical protein
VRIALVAPALLFSSAETVAVHATLQLEFASSAYVYVAVWIDDEHCSAEPTMYFCRDASKETCAYPAELCHLIPVQLRETAGQSKTELVDLPMELSLSSAAHSISVKVVDRYLETELARATTTVDVLRVAYSLLSPVPADLGVTARLTSRFSFGIADARTNTGLRGFSIRAYLRGTAITTVRVLDGADGSYHLDLHVHDAGMYTLEVFIDYAPVAPVEPGVQSIRSDSSFVGEALSGSPFAFRVAPALTVAPAAEEQPIPFCSAAHADALGNGRWLSADAAVAQHIYTRAELVELALDRSAIWLPFNCRLRLVGVARPLPLPPLTIIGDSVHRNIFYVLDEMLTNGLLYAPSAGPCVDSLSSDEPGVRKLRVGSDEFDSCAAVRQRGLCADLAAQAGCRLSCSACNPGRVDKFKAKTFLFNQPASLYYRYLDTASTMRECSPQPRTPEAIELAKQSRRVSTPTADEDCPEMRQRPDTVLQQVLAAHATAGVAQNSTLVVNLWAYATYPVHPSAFARYFSRVVVATPLVIHYHDCRDKYAHKFGGVDTAALYARYCHSASMRDSVDGLRACEEAMSMHTVHPSFLDEAKYLLARRQATEARMRLFDTAAMLLPRDDASNDCVHYYDRNGDNSATMKWLALALVSILQQEEPAG